jgi:hypothetical protein
MRVDETGQQQTARHVHHLDNRICLQVRSDPLETPSRTKTSAGASKPHGRPPRNNRPGMDSPQ